MNSDNFLPHDNQSHDSLSQGTRPDTTTLGESLRQMIAVLQSERQALAALDLDAILGCASDKDVLCRSIESNVPSSLDEECRGLADAARQLNDVNRQIRNLIAANVSARLDTLTGRPSLYRGPASALSPSYAYTKPLRC